MSDAHMTDANAASPSAPVTLNKGLPTPPEDPRPANSMIDETPSKGKGKRPASGEIDDCSGSPVAAPAPVSRKVAPKLVRRHHHRRRNVAATVWGPCFPGSAAELKLPFSVYKAILRHPNLFFQFAIRLPPQAMVDLYAIDKEFHFRFNKYSTSIIHDYATYHARDAAYIFSWVLYPELTITDPMLRPMDGRPHLARDIPSLRWTKMVMYRDHVVRSILTCLGLKGHRLPRQMHTILMKFWLLMEMKTTELRDAFLSNTKVWTDQDIYIFHMFLVKLDMLFDHPIKGHGFIDLSHMLLTQKSLTLLYKIISYKETMDYDDATDYLVKTYHEDDLDIDTHPWLGDETENGVPLDDTGLLMREGWELEGDRMESPVEMVSFEGIRRGLNLQKYLLDFLVYGYVDPDTDQNIPTPKRWRGDKKVVTRNEPWPQENRRVTLLAAMDRRAGIEQKEGRVKRVEVQGRRGSTEEVVMWEGAAEEQLEDDAPANGEDAMEVDA